MRWGEERRRWQPGGTGDVAICLIALLLLLLLLAMFVLASLSSPRSMSSSSTTRVVLLLLVEGSVPRSALYPRNSVCIFLGAPCSSCTIVSLIPGNTNCPFDLLKIKVCDLLRLTHDLCQGVISRRQFGHYDKGLQVGGEDDRASSLFEFPEMGGDFLEGK